MVTCLLRRIMSPLDMRGYSICNSVQDLVEEGILVSPRMMADHMPDYLTAVLQRVAQERTAPGQNMPLDAPDAIQDFQDSVRSHGKPSKKGHAEDEGDHDQASH